MRFNLFLSFSLDDRANSGAFLPGAARIAIYQEVEGEGLKYYPTTMEISILNLTRQSLWQRRRQWPLQFYNSARCISRSPWQPLSQRCRQWALRTPTSARNAHPVQYEPSQSFLPLPPHISSPWTTPVATTNFSVIKCHVCICNGQRRMTPVGKDYTACCSHLLTEDYKYENMNRGSHF